MNNTIYISQELIKTLLDIAERSDPKKISIGLCVNKAESLNLDNIPGKTPIFNDFYFPSGKSLKKIFGVDISTPPMSTQGRFISHPSGFSKLSKRDNFHEIVFIAVPPWDQDSVKVFDRSGKNYELNIIEIK